MPLALTVLSAALTDDGRSVLLVLSAPAAELPPVPCSRVFDAASTASLGGDNGGGAWCSASGRVLTARMAPSAATLQVGQGGGWGVSA